MARVFYDLSDLLSNDTSEFEFNRHEITYVTPEVTAAQSAEWGLGPGYWPGGVALSAESVTLTTHSGTHVDAPSHYGPAVSGHTLTIDEVPLEWCYGPGVRLDFRGADRATGISRADVVAGRAQFWESHLLGREKAYCQIERLANLDSLPQPTGFIVSAFPFKLEGASAGWARVVAIVEE
jgi:kynurenine formamidase